MVVLLIILAVINTFACMFDGVMYVATQQQPFLVILLLNLTAALVTGFRAWELLKR